jgi:hypothetical protein
MDFDLARKAYQIRYDDMFTWPIKILPTVKKSLPKVYTDSKKYSEPLCRNRTMKTFVSIALAFTARWWRQEDSWCAWR